jgi:subtilisin family serine protease
VDVDQQALLYAARDGSAEVLIYVRNPTPSHGLTASEFAIRKRANARALASLLADHGIATEMTDLSALGGGGGRLTHTELQRLYTSNDRRLLGVSLNKPIGRQALSTSTIELRLQPWWDHGYKGDYPSGVLNPPRYPIRIVVFDTGVLRTHPMLQNKVLWEACFGTTFDQLKANGATIAWESLCPNKNAAGDSPIVPPTNGAGMPPGAALCGALGENNYMDPNYCSHGTHVAGIAVGNGDGRSGVAPMAVVDAVNIFSYEKIPVSPPSGFIRQGVWFTKDFLEGLNAVLSFTLPSTQNDHVINASIGSGVVSIGPCTQGPTMIPMESWPLDTPTVVAFANVTQMLKDRGVPLVAAAGNWEPRREYYQVPFTAFPACLPGAIKVMATVNDAQGDSLASYSATPSSDQFPNDYIFAAPGGDSPIAQFGVESAWNSLNATYAKLRGTSMASPHVAGLYALVKGWLRSNGIPATVDGISAWLRDAGSRAVPWDLAALSNAPQGVSLVRTYRVVRLPDYFEL